MQRPVRSTCYGAHCSSVGLPSSKLLPGSRSAISDQAAIVGARDAGPATQMGMRGTTGGPGIGVVWMATGQWDADDWPSVLAA